MELSKLQYFIDRCLDAGMFLNELNLVCSDFEEGLSFVVQFKSDVAKAKVQVLAKDERINKEWYVHKDCAVEK